MSNDKPPIEPFERVIQRLEDGLVRYRGDSSDTLMGDGLVHRFKITYELGFKVLKRYLEYASANSAQLDAMKFHDLLHTANGLELLPGDWTGCHRFRNLRMQTSQAHNEDNAIEVIAGIPDFLEETTCIRDKLLERMGGARQCLKSTQGPTHPASESRGTALRHFAVSRPKCNDKKSCMEWNPRSDLRPPVPKACFRRNTPP